jgi:hypothetical protein
MRNKVVKKFNIDRQSFGHKFWKVLLTFGLVTFAWIFFRANSLAEAGHIIVSIFTARGITTAPAWDLSAFGLSTTNIWIAVLGLIIFWVFESANLKRDLLKELNLQPLAFRWLVYLTIIFVVILFGYFGTFTPESFIYARF